MTYRSNFKLLSYDSTMEFVSYLKLRLRKGGIPPFIYKFAYEMRYFAKMRMMNNGRIFMTSC